MSDISLEGMVDKPVDFDGVLILDRQPTKPRHPTIDDIATAAENIPQSTHLENGTARQRFAGLYERVRGAVSQIKPKALRGIRRVALPVTLAAALAACSAAALTSHTASSGVKVVYPPDFTCHSIASDYGSYYNPDGSKRTFSAPHTAIDVFGDIVVAPANGRVIDIAYHSKAGNIVTLLHTPKDLKNGKDFYLFTYFSHLKESNGKSSASKYIKIGDDVVAGQPIAEVGKTGKNVEYPGSVEHLHFEVWMNRDGVYMFNFGDKDNRGDRLVYVNKGSNANPHDFWARHPLDKPGEVKYIPFSNGEKYGGGFVFPIKCPLPKKKSSLDMGGSNILLGLDLDRIREEITERIIYSQNGSQFKKAV
ncbi:M23 family metallopeptidase [Candidatus Woesearchaeota archaeon]|nr:M23 family metallopeptidase [Candidatus Woesearchaeota archaeon]